MLVTVLYRMDGLQPDRAAQKGDFDAFGLLVDEHQAAIRAFVVSRINDPFEAHDIAQEVFLVAFRKLRQIDAERPISPWLKGIAAHEIRNHLRKRKAIPAGSSSAITELLDAEIETAAPEWKEGPVFEALDLCLTKLGEDARDLIRLRYEEGMDIGEIQSSLGGKHSAITMRLHRLREQLRDCIEGNMGKEAAHG